MQNLRSKQAFDGDQLQNIKLPYCIVMKLQYKYGLDTKLLLCSRVHYPISWIVGVSVFLQYRSLNRRGANIPALAALGQLRRLPYFPSDCQTSMPAFVPLNRYVYFKCQWTVLVLVLVRSIDFYALFVPWPTAIRTKHWLNCGRRTRCDADWLTHVRARMHRSGHFFHAANIKS